MNKFDIARTAAEIARAAWGQASIALDGISPRLDEARREIGGGFHKLIAAISAAERDHDQQRASETD